MLTEPRKGAYTMADSRTRAGIVESDSGQRYAREGRKRRRASNMVLPSIGRMWVGVGGAQASRGGAYRVA